MKEKAKMVIDAVGKGGKMAAEKAQQAAGALGEFVGAAPELGRGHPHIRDEAEGLHVGGRQRAIEVIEDRADRFSWHGEVPPFAGQIL